MGEPKLNERGSRSNLCIHVHLSCKTKEIVVGGKIKDMRNCSYEQMEKLTRTVFHVLSHVEDCSEVMFFTAV